MARSAQFASVPTTIESGFPKLQGTYWTAIVAPAGTPPEIVGKLNAAINAIITSKEMDDTLSRLSAKGKVGSPADVAAFMAAETRKWGEVISAANIKGE
jgi:tripartite-type tricarboxylate transporter receptor subunit TctC